CIGLLLETQRAVQPTGKALPTKAKHVPALAPRVLRRDGSTRTDGAAFGKPSKWPFWRVKPSSDSRRSGRQSARTSEEVRRRESGAVVRPMARTPWCRRQRVGGHSRRSGLPELFCGNAELLDLHVEGLVIHPEEPRRLALVPPRGSKRQADRLPLRLGGRPARDLPQGEAQLSSWPVARSRHCADPTSQFADQCGRPTTVRTAGTALRRCRTA